MIERHSDQDVAALYCAIRDAVASVRAITWRDRWRDFLRPDLAARRREEAIARVYASWQAERAAPIVDADIAPLPDGGTTWAREMVRRELARRAASALPG